MSLQYKEILKSNYFLILTACLISVIVRIPFFNLAPTGKDSFTMYWIGSLALQGKLGTWEINFLSWFGLYPFSGYPIGGVLLFAFLEFFLQSIILTFFVYSTMCAVIAVLLSYKLFRRFTSSVELALIGALIYSTFPDFLLYTYLSGSIRGLFIALIPGFYLICLKFYDKPNIPNFLLIIGGIIFLSLFHRTGMVLVAWIFVLVLLVIIQKSNIKCILKDQVKLVDNIERIVYTVLAILAVIFMFLSSYIIKANPYELTNPWFGTQPGFNVFASVFIDICLRIGPAIFIAFLGISQFLYSKWTKSRAENKYLTLNFMFLFILSPFYTESLYLVLLITLPLIIFSVQFLNNVLNEQNFKFQKLKYMLIGIFFVLFNALYYTVYSIFIVQIEMYVILLLLVSFLFIIPLVYSYFDTNFIGTKKFKRIFYSLLILSVILFSSFQVTAFFARNNTFPYNYLTNQERQVANELKALNRQAPVGRLLISSSKLAIHIMALTGFLSFYDPYSMSYLVDGSINASKIENNSYLLPINQWYYNYIFGINTTGLGFTSSYGLSRVIFKSNMASAIPYFVKYHTRYVITTNSTLVTTDFGPYNSTLIHDLFLKQNATLIYSTKDILLWNLTY